MKHTFKLFTLLLVSLVLITATQAKTVNITDFGAVPDDGGDDSSAISNAIADLPFGGTIIFPGGVTDIVQGVDFSDSQYIKSFRLVGNQGSFINLEGNQTSNLFNFSNHKHIEIEGLIFVGGGVNPYNARTVITIDKTDQFKISNSSFLGIVADVAVIDALDVDLLIEKTQFEGNSAKDSVVRSLRSKGLTISNSAFLKKGHHLSETYKQTTLFSTDAWVRVNNESVTTPREPRTLRILDTTFELGANMAVVVKAQKTVEINGVNISVSNSPTSVGIHLMNVEFAEVKNSGFGCVGSARPAIKLQKNSYLMANSLSLNGSVTFVEMDGSSTTNVVVCPACSLAGSLIYEGNSSINKNSKF